MGFLLFADALGMQNLLVTNSKMADAALESIAREATDAYARHLPGGRESPESIANSSLVVFNDSIFFYCDRMDACIFFASELAHGLFMNPKRRGGPIGVRGAIAKTLGAPRIVSRSVGKADVSRLVVDNMSSALVAEKKKVLGARIVFDRSILDVDQFRSWDYRIQAKVMGLSSLGSELRSDMLQLDGSISTHCDVAWMNVAKAGRFEQIRDQIDLFIARAALSQRPAVHAAATLALHQITAMRRRGLVVVLRQLWNATLGKSRGVVGPRKDDYSAWLACVPSINKVLLQKVYFPFEMKDVRPIPEMV